MEDAATNTEASTSRNDAQDNDDHLMCRVCRGNEGSLYYPCLCTGSIKYVHQECLTEWLKYSKKEVCELCNHKYSFQPIYRPDMPKALPIIEIVKGVLISLSGMLKTWLLYTLVMVAWVGIVPLTAARIYNCIFHLTLHDLFSLPIQLFRTDQIGHDICKGSILLAVFICTFISLVWLREQIVLGGPQHFLNIDDGEDEEAEGQNDEDEAEAGVEEFSGDEDDDDDDDDDEDDDDEEEEDVDDEGQQPADEANVNVAQEAPGDADAAGAADDEDGQPRARAAPGNRPRRAPEAEERAQDQDDNWRDWDRFGEELTWQRLLGLDGSLVFLEHVFWVISLNTLFTVVFAYLPYRFGYYILSVSGVQAKLQYFPSITSILCGYVVIAAIVFALHQIFGFLKLKSLYRAFGITFLILKVFLLVLMEIGFFPILCGCWMDVCTLALFSVNLSQRIATFTASPFMSIFIHWMIGMVYVFYSASFVLLLREILRPGVLWFMRNLNDPEFNPIQEMIDQPFSRHLRRFVISTTLFFTTILLIFYIPLKTIQKVLPSVLPYNVSMSADTPLSELSLELLILQIVLPAILEQAHGRMFVKVAVRQWCIVIGGMLKLDRYLLSDNNANEGARDAQPPAAAVAGGGLAAEHQALLLLREPQTYEPYVRPAWFPLRVFFLLICMALTTSFCSVCTFVVPASIGRLVIYLSTGQNNVHEVYNIGLGLYICWVSGKLSYILFLFFQKGVNHFKVTLKTYLSLAFRIAVVCVPMLVIMPVLLGFYFQLVFMTPLRLSLHQTPLYFPYQDWAMGVLQMKIVAVMVMMGPDMWLKHQLEHLTEQGIENFNATSTLCRLALPLLLYLCTFLAVPVVVATSYAMIMSLDNERYMIFLRFCYPVTLFAILAAGFIRWQLVKFRELAEKIKNEKYLVGTQLVNYER